MKVLNFLYLICLVEMEVFFDLICKILIFENYVESTYDNYVVY